MTVTCSTTRSAMSRSCSISTKPMCGGQCARAGRPVRDARRRQAGRRLVEQDEPRRAGQRHADLQLALLAVRQRRHGLRGDVGEAHALEQIVGRGARGCAARGRTRLKRPRATPRAARNRLSRDRQLAEQQRGLVGAAQPAADALVRRQPVTSSPKNGRGPAVGGKSPVTALNSVVLPAPLAPSTARRSPAATESARRRSRAARRSVPGRRPRARSAVGARARDRASAFSVTGSSDCRASRGRSSRTPPWTCPASGPRCAIILTTLL